MTGLVKTFVATLRPSPLMAIALSLAGLLVGATAVFAIFAVLGPDGASPPAPSDWRPPAFVADEAISQKAAANDVQTLTRPIFSKSRRPGPAPTPGAATKADKEEAPVTPTGILVTGIVKTRHTKRAFIVSPANPAGEWLGAGEKINTWTIATIDATALTLKSGSRSARLQLYPKEEPAPDAH